MTKSDMNLTLTYFHFRSVGASWKTLQVFYWYFTLFGQLMKFHLWNLRCRTWKVHWIHIWRGTSIFKQWVENTYHLVWDSLSLFCNLLSPFLSFIMNDSYVCRTLNFISTLYLLHQVIIPAKHFLAWWDLSMPPNIETVSIRGQPFTCYCEEGRESNFFWK